MHRDTGAPLRCQRGTRPLCFLDNGLWVFLEAKLPEFVLVLSDLFVRLDKDFLLSFVKFS